MPAAYLLTAFAVTALAGWALRPVAAQVGLLDHPGGRKTHAVPTPLVGGLGIFIGVVFTTIWLPEALLAYGPFLSLSALVLFIGTIDDLKQLRATTRMTGQSLVALVMAVVAGVQLHSLGNAFGSELLLGWLGIPFTVFATVGVINAINMSDGIDGLSGGLSAIALAFIAALALAGGQGLHASFVALIVFALLAFLLLNFRRPWGRSALIYLGDGGSTMLGFMLAWLLIDASQGAGALFAPVHALWFLAMPLLDTVNLLIKRPLRGASPFAAGHDHLHHQLLRLGLREGQVVGILLACALLFGSLGLAGLVYGVPEQLLFAAFLAVFAAYFFLVDKLPGSAQASRSTPD